MIKYGYKGLNKIRNKIQSKELKEKGRKNLKDFTRKRKMDFERLIHYILNKKGLCTNMEINNFFNKIDEDTDMSAQALLDQRLKLNPEVFVDLNNEYLQGFYEEYKDTDVKTYKGYILKAIDGSDFELPNTNKVREKYGQVSSKSGETIPRSSVSMCYDLLNEYILDVVPEKYRTSEIEMAKKHIQKDQEISKGYKSIYVMDRNYVSLEFMIYMKQNKIKFVSRLQRGFYEKEIKAIKNKDEIVEIEHTKYRMEKRAFNDQNLRNIAKKEKSTRARIIKYVLNTGEIEYLITNIEDLKYEEIIEIYNKRWGIETMYYSLKSKLQIEKFTSSNKTIIEQDLFAGVLVYNMIQTMKNEATEEIEQKKYKHEMKVNENIAIGVFKNEMIYIMLEEDDDKRVKRYDKLCRKILKYKIPIRKDRNYKIEPRINNKNSYNKLKSF